MAHVVVAEDGNEAGGEFVGNAVERVRQRAVAVDAIGAASMAVGVVVAVAYDVIYVGFDQRMALRQRARARRDDRAGPPGVGERLARGRVRFGISGGGWAGRR